MGKDVLFAEMSEAREAYQEVPLNERQRVTEANRRERVYKRHDPEMKGMIEELEHSWDLSFMGGRIVKAITDPATLLMPWSKSGKFIKLKNSGKAGLFAAGDMALYEKAIYGDVSPLSIGAAVFLGGTSTLLGQTLINRFRKIDEPIRNSKGKIIDRVIIEGEKDVAPNITTKQFQELTDNLITKESKTIDKTLEAYNTLGISSGELNTLKANRAELIIKQRTLEKDKKKVIPAYFQPVFSPLEEVLIYGGRSPIIKGKPIEAVPSRINRQIKELDEKIKIKQDQKDNDLFDYMEGFTDIKVKELEEFVKLGGRVDNTLGIWFSDMAVRPLVGATAGFAVGELILEEEAKANGGLEMMMLTGAAFGVLQGKIQNSNLSVKHKTIINKELKKKEIQTSRRTLYSLAKKWSGGTLAPRLASWGEETGIEQLSKRNLRQQGASLGLGERALETTEENTQKFTMNFIKEAREVVYKADKDLWNTVNLKALPIVFKLRNQFIKPNEVLREINKSIKDPKLSKELEKDVFRVAEGYDNFYKKIELYSLENGINMRSLGVDYGFPQQYNKQFIRENTEESVSILEQALKKENEIQVQRGDYGYWNTKERRFINVEDIENVKSLKYKPIKKLSDKQIKAKAQGSVDRLKQEQIEINSLFTKNDKGFRSWQSFDGFEEKIFVKAAYNLEKTRLVTSPEARKILQPLLIDDPMVLTDNLITNIVPVVEFAKVNGPKGEAINEVFERINTFFPNDRFGNPTKLQLKAEQDVVDMVDALFGRYTGNLVFKKGADTQKQIFAAIQAITVGGNLDKASIPSVAEFIQPFQNARSTKAAMDGFWNSFIKTKEKGERLTRMSDDLGYNIEQKMKMYKIDIPFLFGKKATRVNPQAIKLDNSGYDFMIEIGEDIWRNKNITNAEKLKVFLQKYPRMFMEASGISKITRTARAFAYDSGANDVFYLGKALNKGKKPNQAMLTAIGNLGLDINSVKYIATKGKNAHEAFFADKRARRLLDIAGRKAMNRDGIIPMIGNRILFAQSRNPLVRWAGTFLTWAMAKTTQNNSLFKRMERGDLGLGIKMIGALTLWYPAVHYFQQLLSTSDRVKDEFFNGSFYKRLASTIRFSGQVVPWYLDKIGNIIEYNMESLWDGISPQTGWISTVGEQAGKAIQDPTTIPEGILTITEKSLPLAEDISYHTGLEEFIKDDDDDDDEGSRGKFFTGGAVSEDYPVPNVISDPSERINPYTGQPYDAEMERLGFKDGGSGDKRIVGITKDGKYYLTNYGKGSILVKNAPKKLVAKWKRLQKKDGGLMVSIGVSPISEKQISKIEKALKKRKAKRDGGYIRQQYGFGDVVKKALKRRAKKTLQDTKYALSEVLIGAGKEDINDLDQRTINALINNIDKIENEKERTAALKDIDRYKAGTPIPNLSSPFFNALRHAKLSYEYGDKAVARPALIAKERAQSKGIFYKGDFKTDLTEAESRAEKIDALNNVASFNIKDEYPDLDEEGFNQEFLNRFNKSSITPREDLQPGVDFYLRESDAVGVAMPSIFGN